MPPNDVKKKESDQEMVKIKQEPCSSTSGSNRSDRGQEYTESDGDFEAELQDPVNVIEVKCGTVIAKLHLNRFICPGIHKPCIELNNSFISPKEFTVLSNKDKQKDWKGSIRVGKSNLRTLMDMGSIDFFNHKEECSAKCQSRNYISSKDLVQYRLSYDETETLDNPTLGSLVRRRVVPSTKAAIASALRKQANAAKLKEELSDLKNGTQVDELISMLSKEPVFFWNEMHRMDMGDAIINMMISNLNTMRVKLGEGQVAGVAPLLSRTIVALGISERVGSAVKDKCAGNMKPRLSRDFSSLEENLTRKRPNDETIGRILDPIPSKISPDVITLDSPLPLDLNASSSDILMNLVANIMP